MPWIQLSLDVPAGEDVSRYEDALLGAGALCVTLIDAADNPVLEPGPGETPLWEHIRAVGLFDAEADMNAAHQRLQLLLGAAELPGLSINPLEDRDWTRAWMDSFRPMRFGERLWVCPEGFEPPEPTAVNLRLDPGLAFGTGTHPTTALCLEWLDAHPPQGAAVIDYGCGSGILAVAAALLGAERILAVDNDPQALAATQENARKNGVSDRIIVCAPEALPEFQADVLLANILAGPLVALAPRFAGLLRTGGALVLSGILDSQAGTVAAAYADGFDMAPPAQREEWVRLDGLRK